ncbi:TlpA family protein disulfide reductase [Noviherbaspirillum aridicola]|uniref:Thioredoxin n=1 Tax=Noviherbaspirillum aridicola TaxID=2849687 RepID=A0ABQ4Q1S7_9BURK|nr:TlpA disulfide reductase family protein [Noviherbaspirillum aridicola]GIZ50991.1 thioredoxin [Noviherbaspirillum aridicola]
MKGKIAVFAAVALLFAGLGIWLGHRQTAPAPAESSAVQTLLTQTLNDASGQPQPLSQWKDRPLVVNFWATWCAPCVDEMPELSALQQEVGGRGIQILGIGIDSPSNIAEFGTKYKISYPLYAGGMSGTELSRRFGNQAGGLPYTVLIDRQGQVKKTYIGRLKMDELKTDLAAL